jgi:hypothetical protein
MSRKEVISIIKRNGHNKTQAIILISDFLLKNKEDAIRIYEEEFENVSK